MRCWSLPFLLSHNFFFVKLKINIRLFILFLMQQLIQADGELTKMAYLDVP